MQCDRAIDLFSDYCEGTLERAMQLTLENHIEGCAPCRYEVSDLSNTWATLDSAPRIEPPSDFRQRVWGLIESAEHSAHRKPARTFDWRSLLSRRALAWTAAAALVLILAPIVVPGNR